MSRLHDPARPDLLTGTTQRVPVVGGPALSASGSDFGPVIATRRRRTFERRVLVVGGALLGGVLAAAVLAGSMSDAMSSRAAALEARGVNAQIEARVVAGRTEVEFANTSAFLGFASRSFGYGRTSKERLFALAPGAPRPPVITPLGRSVEPTPLTDTLGSVLDLLFER